MQIINYYQKKKKKKQIEEPHALAQRLVIIIGVRKSNDHCVFTNNIFYYSLTT